MNGKEKAFNAHKQVELPVNQNGEASAKPFVSHVWLVQQSDDDVNMELTWVSETVGPHDVLVPILRNKRKLKEGEPLARAKNPHASPPASKKQKTSK